MYLHDEMEDGEGNTYPMAGVIPGRTFPAGKLTRFGYINITAGDGENPVPDRKDDRMKGQQEQNEWYLRPGETIRGHEFHYWDSEDNGAAYQAQKTSGQSYPCIRRERATEAGFPHLYYPSAPAYAKRFLEACGEFQVRKTRRRR